MNSRFFNQKEIFPFLDILSDNFDVIEKEMKNSIWYDWPEYNLWNKYGQEWKVCPIYGFGSWKYEKEFPQLISLLKQIPGLRIALFSRIGGKTKLKPHQGWASIANDALRCHLGIVNPIDGKSGVEVEKEFCQVETGKWIVFDDSKMHTGLNEGTTDKIVLIVDIDRPKWVAKGKSNIRDTPELINFINSLR